VSDNYRNFLALSYEELEELNLKAKSDRLNRVPADEIREAVEIPDGREAHQGRYSAVQRS
jgi:hypothetical protein